MKRVFFAFSILTALFISSCSQTDDVIYPLESSVQMTEDDENSENGTKSKKSVDC